MKTTNNKQQLAIDRWLDDLLTFLEYKKEEGFQTIEISQKTLKKLGPTPLVVSSVTTQTQHTMKCTPKRQKDDDIIVNKKTLNEISTQITECTACPLSKTRKNAIPGEGNSKRPDILFIGEEPGIDEDEQGRPFVGEVGQLFDKMIRAMGYTREQIFITNILKCHPPKTHPPLPEETGVCLLYLRTQIAILQPKIIVALGKIATERLLGRPVAITRFRGTWCTYENIDLMPTYHPAYLIHAPGRKGEAWADLKAVLAKLKTFA